MPTRFLHFAILFVILLLVVSGVIVLRGVTEPARSAATTIGGN